MADPAQKKCPFCGELIRAEAVKCRFCGEFLETPAGGRLSQADKSRHVPQGHDLMTDTEVIFEGNISRVVLVGPAIATALALVAAVLIYSRGRLLPSYSHISVYIAASLASAAILNWLIRWFWFKNLVFRISNDRIEIEKGILSKSITNLDMWRVQDLRLNQSLLQRIFGLGVIHILSSDKDTRSLPFGPVHGARELYQTLKRVSMDADRRRGVVHIEQ